MSVPVLIPILRLFSGQAWLALALGGVMVFELHGLPASGKEGADAPVTVQIPLDSQGAIGPDRSEIQAWGSHILDRPLMAPSRSPNPAPLPAGARPAAIPRLTGVLIYGNHKLGFFLSARGGEIVAAQGSKIGDFKILSISAGSVVVRGPAGVTEVRIAYDGTRRLSGIAADPAPSSDDVDGSPWANSWTKP